MEGCWVHKLVEGVDDSGWCETLMAIHGGDNALNGGSNSGCGKHTRCRGKDLQPQTRQHKPGVSPLHQDRKQIKPRIPDQRSGLMNPSTIEHTYHNHTKLSFDLSTQSPPRHCSCKCEVISLSTYDADDDATK